MVVVGSHHACLNLAVLFLSLCFFSCNISFLLSPHLPRIATCTMLLGLKFQNKGMLGRAQAMPSFIIWHPVDARDTWITLNYFCTSFSFPVPSPSSSSSPYYEMNDRDGVIWAVKLGHAPLFFASSGWAPASVLDQKVSERLIFSVKPLVYCCHARCWNNTGEGNDVVLEYKPPSLLHADCWENDCFLFLFEMWVRMFIGVWLCSNEKGCLWKTPRGDECVFSCLICNCYLMVS